MNKLGKQINSLFSRGMFLIPLNKWIGWENK